tara:strand:- start:3614 stop:3922 length:309 start_codon:yes stop_codon:yes gene_type:complete
MLEHKGFRWGYVFLTAAAYISPEDVQTLMKQAVEMFLNDEYSRDIIGDSFEGQLFTQKKYELIGEIGGQRFDAELETESGRDKASFLVSEQTQGVGSSISMN